MAASIRGGAGRADDPAAGLPELDAADLAMVIEVFDQAPDVILRRASADGRPGHPVIFPADLREKLQDLRGDEAARSVLAQHPARIALIALPDHHALTDLDTPEAWAAWRAGRPG